jgi:hypothetical protein
MMRTVDQRPYYSEAPLMAGFAYSSIQAKTYELRTSQHHISVRHAGWLRTVFLTLLAPQRGRDPTTPDASQSCERVEGNYIQAHRAGAARPAVATEDLRH